MIVLSRCQRRPFRLTTGRPHAMRCRIDRHAIGKSAGHAPSNASCCPADKTRWSALLVRARDETGSVNPNAHLAARGERKCSNDDSGAHVTSSRQVLTTLAYSCNPYENSYCNCRLTMSWRHGAGRAHHAGRELAVGRVQCGEVRGELCQRRVPHDHPGPRSELRTSPHNYVASRSSFSKTMQ